MARTKARITRKGPDGVGETHYLDVEKKMSVYAEDIRLMEVYSGGNHVRYYCDDDFGYISIRIPGILTSNISIDVPISIQVSLGDDGIIYVAFTHDDRVEGVKFTATEEEDEE